MKKGDSEIFREAMADVKPMREHDRIEPAPARPAPRAVQQARDDAEVLRELMDLSNLDSLETGEELMWLKPGYPQRTLRRLRRGHFSVADTIDLHHMNVETARRVLLDFIEHALRRGHGCIRIIHGKGLRSRAQPRLKILTNRVLFKHPRVVAYASCTPVNGGTGATDVLLSAPRARRR
jgi:DNA-nicking Smr family endonuclease